MAAYVVPERVERKGVLVAFEGEVITEDEARERGILDVDVLTDYKVDELKAMAAELGIKGVTKKDDLIAAIEAARTVEPDPEKPEDPAE